jgi:hypothetical protein
MIPFSGRERAFVQFVCDSERLSSTVPIRIAEGDWGDAIARVHHD